MEKLAVHFSHGLRLCVLWIFYGRSDQIAMAIMKASLDLSVISTYPVYFFECFCLSELDGMHQHEESLCEHK